MTVLEVIQRSTEFLAKKGVDSPRLQTELILAQLLQMPRLKLYLNFERNLAEPELETLRGWVRRRAEREPLQHILGSTSFCGLEIAVSRDALIPRPESELLTERAGQLLATIQDPRPSVLDFGTGTGCLAIALAVKCPQVSIHALDVSAAALELARANAARHLVSEWIQFHCGDGFAALPAGVTFDLLMSNPPYIPSAEIDSLEPEVRLHDPRLALDGGADGLDFYRRLASEAAPYVKPGGHILLEFGDGQSAAIREIFERQKWIVEAVERDYSDRERIVTVRRG